MLSVRKAIRAGLLVIASSTSATELSSIRLQAVGMRRTSSIESILGNQPRTQIASFSLDKSPPFTRKRSRLSLAITERLRRGQYPRTVSRSCMQSVARGDGNDSGFRPSRFDVAPAPLSAVIAFSWSRPHAQLRAFILHLHCGGVVDYSAESLLDAPTCSVISI